MDKKLYEQLIKLKQQQYEEYKKKMSVYTQYYEHAPPPKFQGQMEDFFPPDFFANVKYVDDPCYEPEQPVVEKKYRILNP